MKYIMDSISNLVSLFKGNWLLVLGDVLILGLAAAAAVFFLKYLAGLRIRQNIERIRQRFFLNSQARELSVQKEIKESGYREKHGVLERIDALFKQAGYLGYESRDTTETILIKVGIVMVLCGSIAGLVTRSGVIMAAVCVICAVGFWIVTQVVADRNYVAVENEILRFINMADGYAAESDDIVYIIGKVYPNLKEPMFSYGKDFYYEALHVGSEVAFQHFEERIAHKKFREIIHNVYVCSKTSTNYKKIFREARLIMRDYVDGKKERLNIKKEKTMDFFVVVGLAVWSVTMADGLSDNFYELLFGTAVGNILVIAFVLVIAASALMIFKVDKK